jgi:hypothetical protein
MALSSLLAHQFLNPLDEIILLIETTPSIYNPALTINENTYGNASDAEIQT